MKTLNDRKIFIFSSHVTNKLNKFRNNKIRNNSICHQTCGFWASTDQVMFRFQGGNQQGQTVHKNFQTAGVC